MNAQQSNGLKWFHALVFLVVSGLLFLAGPKLAIAQDYPTKQIIIYAGSTPGSVYGLVPQLIGDYARKYLKNSQPIMVVYKPGASHTAAADYVMKQPADGYSIDVVQPDMVAKLAEDPKAYSWTLDDLIYIGTYATSPLMLSVLKTRPWNTIEDLVDYAKKNPGKLSYGSIGVGSGPHIIAELMSDVMGIKLNHIPFTGGPPAVTAVLGGHVDICLLSIGSTREHIKPEGALKVLAVMDTERFYEVKDIPTFLERGYPGIDWCGRISFGVKKGTPKPIVDHLRDVFKKAADESDVKQGIMKFGYKPLNLGQEGSKKLIDGTYEVARKIHQKIGTAK